MNEVRIAQVKAAETVKTALMHAIAYIVTMHPGGRIPPEDQHAIRILKSLHRYQDRLLTLHFGTEEEQRVAVLEFSLTNQDRGDLFTIGLKKHAIGRFSCPSCEKMESLENPQEMVSMAALCGHCSKGIAHVGVEIHTVVGEGKGEGPAIDPSASNDDLEVSGEAVAVMVWVCDGCGRGGRVE